MVTKILLRSIVLVYALHSYWKKSVDPINEAKTVSTDGKKLRAEIFQNFYIIN